MTAHVAPATLDDLDRLASLFDRYRQFYRQPPDLEGTRQFLADRLAARESVVLLAVQDGEAVGFTQLYPSFSSVGMRRTWVLNDLFVAEAARCRGIARALLDAARALAAETGAARIELATERTNAPAKALYHQTGYILNDRFDHYHLDLPAPAGLPD